MTTAVIDEVQDKALLAVPERPPSPPAAMMVEVARKYGVSPLRQMRESFGLAMGKQRFHLHEYYTAGLYDPEISAEEKRQYVGLRASYKLNTRLGAKGLVTMRSFAADKVLFTSLIRQLGFGTTQTQAVVSAVSRFGSIPTLETVEQLRSFLTEKAQYPLFGKPQSFSGSYGSALLLGVEGEMLLLGNGKRVALDGFCKEIIDQYGSGYLLQSALVQHPEMVAVTGKAVGSLRVVTVRDSNRPQVLYSAWKIPAPDAMSDNFWQSGSMIAPVDAMTGKVGQARIGTGLDARDIDDHPVSGAKITGKQLPMWDRVREMVCEAHAVVPEFGIVGWDVAIGPDGPMIIEHNANPFHTLYQLSHCRGINNPDFMPIFDRVSAYSKELLEGRRALEKARTKEIRRTKKRA
ncbi:hypothetical protein GI582_02545 [Sulfitobacter sp. BDSS02]|nr:hypothetical protein [Sulfitobacter sp. BDSS02]MBR9847776.1 hypothetical protein [Paracoccaceae bacterium]